MQGLLLLNKPNSRTSFSCVSQVKRLSHQKRVGHTGTLDPMATGVLPILLGRSTALCGLMLDADKRYTAEIKLGVTTDTEDITGKILEEKNVSISNEKLTEAINHFVGEIFQVPPMYSAIKKDGVRLYKLAREGKTVEIEKRKINIYSIDMLSPLNEENIFKIDVHVSKGTYIRSLARDIGEYLGCGATLFSLVRTYAGGFDIKDCHTFDEIDENNIEKFLLSEEKAVEHLKQINVTDKQAKRFCNGGQLSFERLNQTFTVDNELYRVTSDGLFLGVGITDLENQQLSIKCVINYPAGCER